MSSDYFTMQSPLGPIEICAVGRGIRSTRFVDAPSHPNSSSLLLTLAATQLGEYFEGRRQRFELPLCAQGTAFQQQVWQALLDTPFGETSSYRDIAKRINRPSASRAVGAANSKNPLAIVVPCHRIIAANGALTGYAGGLERKAWLLAHEQRQLPLMQPE